MKRGASAMTGRWGRCPQTPGIYRFAAKMAEGKTSGRPRPQPPRATSAAESALGLRPRRALSSAQLGTEWSNSTSPYNDFSANGAYPLNSVSHSRGSLHCRKQRDTSIPLFHWLYRGGVMWSYCEHARLLALYSHRRPEPEIHRV